MSASAQAWAETVNLGPRTGFARKLLAYLAWRMNHKSGLINPSIERMMADLGRCERSIRYGLRLLESVGLLDQHRRGRGRTCRYTLHVGRTPNLSAARRRRNGSKCAPQQPEVCPSNGAKCAPRTPQSVPPELSEGFNQEGEPRVGAHARATPTAPQGRNSSIRKTTFADAPIRELRQLAIEAGFDPDDLTEEMGDWCADEDHRSADWMAFGRRWVRREREYAQQRAARQPQTTSLFEQYFANEAPSWPMQEAAL
jgi:hypothetical protein